MPAALMSHDVDPKQDILDRVGDISGVEVFGSDVLVALYIRPEKTRGGIILADSTREEDRWQGKVGLILKMGATAFCDDNGEKFRDISVGDYVVFRPSDGFPVQFNSPKALSSKDAVPCRVVTDIHLRLRVSSPDAIY